MLAVFAKLSFVFQAVSVLVRLLRSGTQAKVKVNGVENSCFGCERCSFHLVKA